MYERDLSFAFGDSFLSVRETSSRSEDSNMDLVFLHGRFSDSMMWETLGKALSQQFRCWFVDLPGFGRSFCSSERGLSSRELTELTWKLLSRLMPAERRFFMIGHDMGGTLAQLCALRKHEASTPLLEGLILLSPVPITESIRSGITVLGWIVENKLKRAVQANRHLTHADRAMLLSPWRTRGLKRNLLRSIRAFEAHPHAEGGEANASLDIPSLVLWGGRDRLNPVENARAVLSRFSEADYFQNDECGHWPCLENHEWVLAKVQEFLFRTCHSVYPLGHSASA